MQKIAFKKLQPFVVLSVSVLFIFLSCQKRVQDVTAMQTNNEAFFSSSKPVNEKTVRLINVLKNYNAKTNFIKQLPNSIGLPVWSRTYFNDKKQQALRTIYDDDNTVVTCIPLTKDDEYLSGILLVKTTEDSVVSMMLYTSRYLYDICHDPLSIVQARQALGLFLFMDYETFGAVKFENIPKSLFPEIEFVDQTKSTTEIILDTTSVTGDNNPRLTSTCFRIEWQAVNCGTPELACCSGADGCDATHPDGCPSGQCSIGTVSVNICAGPVSTGGNGNGSGGTVLLPPPATGGGSGGGGEEPDSEPAPPCGGMWYRTKECSGNQSPQPVPSDGEECNNKLNDLVLSAVPTHEIDEITTLDEKPDTRTKKYSWVILKSLTWRLYSWEIGVHEKVSTAADPSLEWKWKSLTHQSLGLVGVVFGGSVDYTLLSAIPTMGQYNALMDIDYKVKYSALCQGSPFSTELTYNSKQAFNVND